MHHRLHRPRPLRATSGRLSLAGRLAAEKVLRCVQAEGRSACGGLRGRRRERPREAAHGTVNRISVVAGALPVDL